MSSLAQSERASMRSEYSLRSPPLRLYILRRQQQFFSVSSATVAKWRDFRNDHRRLVIGLLVELTQWCP